MASPIEHYAIIGDTETVALVSRTGSIDWFCAPRFDSGASFAALLGDEDNGSWRIAAVDEDATITRTYRGDTLVLETVFETATGSAALIDFMPVRGAVIPDVVEDVSLERKALSLTGDPFWPTIIRIIEGRTGTVDLRSRVSLRFDYGSIVPWVQAHADGAFSAVGGIDACIVRSSVTHEPTDLHHGADFTVTAGQRERFSLTWFPSHLALPPRFDIDLALRVTERWWEQWVARGAWDSPYDAAITRSVITLKALTYAPTGGIVAAPTTSLPEHLGGVRNWDYRYCWLRDASYVLATMLDAGFDREATSWSDWLRRSVAGRPQEMQIMYGLSGERRLPEMALPWLDGYENSKPVRVGNAASEQFQLDVYGEVMDMLLTVERNAVTQTHRSGRQVAGLPDDAIDLARNLVTHVAEVWREPDEGIWEIRGPRRHFVHSKVMAWVAIDRWLHLIEQKGLADDPAPWKDLCAEMHEEICAGGFDEAMGSFTQYYGSGTLDGSLLALALVGFLEPDDPRLIGTIEAIQRDLTVEGFVLRYRTDTADEVDGLPAGEGAFLLTTFWLVDCLVLIGRADEATRIYERLVSLTNDVGLLSEEVDTANGRLLGNFPQAFSHVGIVSSALNLASPERAGQRRTS
jgi:GH15 family glucan-1,4-alpha-glucosidase